MRTIKENKYEKFINQAIIDHEKNKMINTNNISDGQHTFGELYEHRAKLFSVICNQESISERAWKSKLHSDGSMYENYFIVGISTPDGQATYHYEMKYWDLFNVKELEKAPKWDGHTSDQAINRLLSLNKKENKSKSKSIGQTIDELFNNPYLVIQSCNNALVKTKEEAEKITNKNKKLEEEIIEKDKGLEFLNGRIEGMEYVIEHLNLKVVEEN